MAHPLLINPSEVVKLNYLTAGTEAFRSAGTGSDLVGTTAGASDAGFGTTPDGATDAGWVYSDANTNVILDANVAAGTYSGRQSFLVYVDEFNEASTGFLNVDMNIRVDNDGGFSGTWADFDVKAGYGWNHIMVCDRVDSTASTANVGIANWNDGGTAGWDWGSAMTFPKWRFRVSGIASTNTKIYVAQVVTRAIFKSRHCHIIDDGLAAVYTLMRDYINSLEVIKPSLAIIGSKVNTGGYMTDTQINQLYEDGWEILNHTWLHESGKATESYAYWEDEILTNQEYLASNGWTRRNGHRHFVSPYGDFLDNRASAYRQAVEANCLSSLGTTDANCGAMLLQKHYHTRHNMRTHSGGIDISEHLYRFDTAVGAGACPNFMWHNFTAGATAADIDNTVADAKEMFAQSARYHVSGMSKCLTWTERVAEAGTGFQLVA